VCRKMVLARGKSLAIAYYPPVYSACGRDFM
jgi:hypothetical protein